MTFAFLAIVLFVLCTVQNASACSCLGKPTVLDAFEDADVVVITKLVSVEKINEKEGEYDTRYITSVKMLVQKVYKGNVKEGALLTFAQGGGADCIWTFDEAQIGIEYLFYLAKPSRGHPMLEPDKQAPLMYYAVTCGRSRSITGAKDDLSYLNNIQKLQGKTRFSGTLDVWFDDGPSFANLNIKIVGKNKTYQTKTDKDGFFEIYDLPPGDYFILPTIPFGWKINNYMLERSTSLTRQNEYDRFQVDLKKGIPVTIKPKRHSNLDLIFDIDTAIIGRILSPAGKPMKNVCLMAVSTELKEGDYRGRSDCTNENGEFLIEEMASGNYVLVINAKGKLDGDSPFGTFFYPGVLEFKDAAVISIEAGKYIKGMDVQVPQTIELVDVSGRFVYSNDKPVADEWVKFEPDDKARYDGKNVKTDSDGGFKLRIPKGASGKLLGEMYTYSGEFIKCPALEKLISESGSTSTTVHSERLFITGDENQTELKLIFPFPSCVKARE